MEEAKMRKFCLVAVCVGATLVCGCTGTAVSRQPSQSEIDEGVQRRLAEVDKIEGISPEQKAAMKQHIQSAAGAKRPTGREGQ